MRSPQYWKPLVEFLVASGARWSEAIALKPSSIDVTHGIVRITKAWEEGEGGGYTLGVPKTRKSVRTINVPAGVLKTLDLTGELVFATSGRGRGQNVTSAPIPTRSGSTRSRRTCGGQPSRGPNSRV